MKVPAPLVRSARLLPGLALLAAATLWLLGKSDANLPANAIQRSRAQASPSPQQDAKWRDLVLGTWQDHYEGTRTLTVRPDGTAFMLVELEGWKATMFTPRLNIETSWSIENGRFHRQIVGGHPADKVDFVKRRVGDRASDRIIHIDADEMTLVDQDGRTRYSWKRLK